MSASTVTFETGHEEMIVGTHSIPAMSTLQSYAATLASSKPAYQSLTSLLSTRSHPHCSVQHDAQLDYYGKRLATASSDRTIRIFDVALQSQTLLARIAAHDGPIWQVQWAHPKFGPLLASASYDGRAIVWKEVQQGQWVKVFETARPEASMNSISWAPHSFGLILACACSDGTVTVCTRRDTDGRWEQQTFVAHKGGVNSISWGPDVKTGALLAAANAVPAMKAERRFVTGGCDNRIRIWRQSDADGSWEDQPVFTNSDASHSDWVRDVAWAPSLGLPANTIASASEDKTVALWYEEVSGEWRRGQQLTFDSGVWRVSWSVNGNVLAVSQGDQKVSLWKEAADGQWKQVSTEQE